MTFCIVESKAEISIKVTGVLTEGQNEGERSNRSVPYVEVAPSGPESLAWFQKMGTHLENFFSLLTGASCSLETMFVYRGEDNAHVVFRRNRHATRFDRSLCVMCAPGQLAYGLAHWLTMPARFDAVESLALVVLRKGKLFVETEFLALAQALEGFHRATEIKGVVSKAEFRRARN